MDLAYVMTEQRGDIDKLLSGFAQDCLLAGIKVAGVVQTNTETSISHHCDMDVKVLPDGSVFRISQTLGKASRGCRLDPSALEAAVAEVGTKLTDSTDILVINKFGKHEAEGRGFRDLIADALARDVPVLIGVNRLNHSAFLEFVGAEATRLTSSPQALSDWFAAIAAEHETAA